MKTYTKVVREGEWFPLDLDFDLSKHDGGSGRPEGWQLIREIAADPKGWRFAPSGFNSFEVVMVGMYDGWPYWRPTPAIGYRGPLGSIEVAFFDRLRRDLLTRKHA